MVWEGSGEDLGRFWEGFGKVLGFKRQAFWKTNLFSRMLVFLRGVGSIMHESFLILSHCSTLAEGVCYG